MNFEKRSNVSGKMITYKKYQEYPRFIVYKLYDGKRYLFPECVWK